MRFRPSARPRLVGCYLLLMIIASGCGLRGDEAVASSPTPVETPAELLPSPDSTPAVAEATEMPGETVSPTPTEQVPEPTEPVAADMLSCLSTRVRVAQLLLPLVTQPELAGARVFAADGELGGIGLLGQPDERLAGDLEALQLASFVPVLVASDEEGGGEQGVQRLASLLGPIPYAAETAQSKSPEDVRKQWVEYGSRVKALGVDVVFGPVVDVGAGPGIASRSFGDDPEVVTAYGRAVAEGLLEAGVLPVFKHFPGHGHATADSHDVLPTTPALNELRTSDLLPYVDLLSDPVLGTGSAVMIGHLAVPGLTNGAPTSLSPETINGLLRGELGFGGLVITDAINMGAIVNTYGRLDALELAILAGSDIVILGSLADLTPSLDYLVDRVESDPAFAAIIDNRAERILAAKGQESICVGAQ